MSLNVNNNNNIDPAFYQQQISQDTDQTEQLQQPAIAPIQHEDDVLTEASNSTTALQVVANQLHLAPVIFQSANALTAAPGTTIKTASGVVIASPDRFNDLMDSASQLADKGYIPSRTDGMSLQNYIKIVSDAIKQLQDALNEAQVTSNATDRKFHTYALDDNDSVFLTPKPTTVATSATVKEETAADNGLSTKTDSANEAVSNLLKQAKIDPKVGDLISLFSQLQFLMQNTPNNVTGGIIIGNNPEVVLAMQKLGISLPTANPDALFAGMASQLAAENKPPYNDQSFKDLANALPKGWEVMTRADLSGILSQIAQNIRKISGDAYGILAKPLQSLFGTSFFSLNSTDPRIQQVRDLVELKQALNTLMSTSEGNRAKVAAGYKDIFNRAVKNGLLNNKQTPQTLLANKGFSNGFYGDWRTGVMGVKYVLMDIDKKINARGGQKILVNNDPIVDRTGVTTMAAGALVGNATSSVSNSVTQLLKMQLTNSFGDSTLSVEDKKNIQQLASLSILTSILGEAVKEKPILKGSGPQKNLTAAITKMKDSGAAQSLVSSVFANSISNGNLSLYQQQVLQDTVQAFMTSIGAMSTTADQNGVNPTQAYSTLSSLRSNLEISSEVSSAQAFIEADANQIGNDATQFLSFARQIAPNADHDSGAMENLENLREMIKLLKKILEELLSGGQSTQQISDAISKVREGMGTFESQGGFQQGIPG
ncbi:hypothetical protein PHSC3_001063 [Chlamydiales bacterium STE3]|nr:hypothetical protein PHSC3_001063 [Chlamydiales bacterium STE3]